MKTWKREHLDKLRKDLPEAVIEGALRIIETLDRHYGEDRDVDMDLGGIRGDLPGAARAGGL